MDRNLACIEVKPCTRPYNEFRDDLKKLIWFCRHAEYHGAIFLVYGGDDDETAEHDLFKENFAGPCWSMTKSICNVSGYSDILLWVNRPKE